MNSKRKKLIQLRIEQVKDEMMNCDWIEHEGKDYCRECFAIGDNDEIVIKSIQNEKS